LALQSFGRAPIVSPPSNQLLVGIVCIVAFPTNSWTPKPYALPTENQLLCVCALPTDCLIEVFPTNNLSLTLTIVD
jgi:hypothetical protein